MRESYLSLTHDNYLSLSDIMVTDEALSCTLLVDFYRLGYIQRSENDSDGDLTKGTTLDLPLWMVRLMKRHQYVQFQLPSPYQEEARRILSADPGVVEFRQGSRCRFTQNHYPLGLYLIPLADSPVLNASLTKDDKKARKSLTYDEAKDVRKSLVSTFQLRFRQIMDWSNGVGQDTVCHRRLERSERQLLEIGKAQQKSLVSWLQGKSKNLRTSTVTKNAKIRPDSSDSRKRARV